MRRVKAVKAADMDERSEYLLSNLPGNWIVPGEFLLSSSVIRLFTFPVTEEQVAWKARDCTFAVFLSFVGEDKMQRCWAQLRKTVQGDVDIWFHRRRWLSGLSGVHCDPMLATVQALGKGECCIILVFKPGRLIRPSLNGPNLQSVVEEYLGCFQQKGDGASPLFKDAVVSFELVEVSYRREWLRRRQILFDKCHYWSHLDDIALDVFE